MASREIKAGDPDFQGARRDREGGWFSLYSAHAEAVELCLFDPSGRHLIESLFLPEQTHEVWHGFVPRLPAGASYGYRVHGPYDPHAGHRFNPAKLLLDPFARGMAGEFRWDESHFGYERDHPELDLVPDRRDNAPFMPKGTPINLAASHGAPHGTPIAPSPRIPWPRTVIYECHVKGFTHLHPALPESLRGSYAGLARPEIIGYLKSLGVTTVELMPVHAFIGEYGIAQKGLTNYWGYNSLNFFCPHPAYGRRDAAAEFRAMVDAFHQAGLEVILDVVFNHTCEGDQLGPTLSYRGIDNRSYYQLLPGDQRFYINDSGCGNSINIAHPQVLRLILDSLRHWVREMGVDGFRFDLAAMLGRRERGFDPGAPLFQALAEDPALAGVKLIAEPWDLGPGGYQLGAFPPPWAEWNDRYRDTMRRFWRGDPEQLPELGRRLHGSSDLFEAGGRKPWASINHVACHDGFTLRDLVSYGQRHNEANGEENRDGHKGNFSDNFGFEGPSADPAVDSSRWRRQANLLATLALSQGVPMITAGDEFGRSQRGNNNAWCQDNELNWIDWDSITPAGRELREFVARLFALRRRFPALQAREYRHGDIEWLAEDGSPMGAARWHEPDRRLLGYLLREAGASLLAIFNASDEDAEFRLPGAPAGNWELLLDTTALNKPTENGIFAPGRTIMAVGQSTRLLLNPSAKWEES